MGTIDSSATVWRVGTIGLSQFHPDPNVSYAASIGAIRDLLDELQPRAHYADPVAISSARHPRVDDLTVRQTGAIAYAPSGVVSVRIDAGQQRVFSDVRKRSSEKLNTLVALEVTTGADGDG
ncbi:hypothetical protein [Microlunatus aurantiacus]|uniref:hypothetical protein n=1 Tax=Microlunatus aurantiacus TaxID=446786 RepID=UPI0031D9AFD2